VQIPAVRQIVSLTSVRPLTGTTSRSTLLFAPCKGINYGYDTHDWRKIFRGYLNDTPGVIAPGHLDHPQYLQYIHDAVFCGVIPGDTSSTSKLSQFIFGGCIPVIFVPDLFELPFAAALNYSSFTGRPATL
jgi:hypothetical protein